MLGQLACASDSGKKSNISKPLVNLFCNAPNYIFYCIIIGYIRLPIRNGWL
jgi:hypothetical protein